jgi:LPXTG-motif cell wall-anchored protein
MRKLVVVMLTVGSLLLLEAPALAQHLYILPLDGKKSGGRLSFTGTTDCPGTVQILFVNSVTRSSPTTASLAKSDGEREFTVTLPANASKRRPKIQSATCDGVEMTLPKTGVSPLHRLALAAFLLAGGVVLLFLGRRQTGARPS